MKISIAMTTYNGGKYISQQLESILAQTRLPDEIVISDDGSTDDTLSIIKGYAASKETSGIDFRIITDNPKKGWITNFVWACSHTTGDIVFICDQDDIWTEDKIAKVEKAFTDNPDALLVFHNISAIDGNSKPHPISDKIDYTKSGRMDVFGINPEIPNEVYGFDRSFAIPKVISRPLANGMSICISKDILDTVYKCPDNYLFDQWCEISALLHGNVYYINSILTKYRLHDSNVTFTDRRTSLFKKIGRFTSKAKKTWFTIDSLNAYELIRNMMMELSIENEDAFKTVDRIIEVGMKKKDIVESGRLSGSIKLLKLYRTDPWFRKSGPKELPFQLCAVLSGRVR